MQKQGAQPTDRIQAHNGVTTKLYQSLPAVGPLSPLFALVTTEQNRAQHLFCAIL
jgi:hypothetical protein